MICRASGHPSRGAPSNPHLREPGTLSPAPGLRIPERLPKRGLGGCAPSFRVARNWERRGRPVGVPPALMRHSMEATPKPEAPPGTPSPGLDSATAPGLPIPAPPLAKGVGGIFSPAPPGPQRQHETHPLLANLSTLLTEMDRRHESLELLAEASAIFDQALGTDQPMVVKIHQTLARRREPLPAGGTST